MESVKKSIDKRALHKRECDSRVNERQMQTTEEKVDTRNDVDADDVDIKPVYDEEPIDEHYKELSDSIKTTRAKTIEHTTSLIAKNTKFKAQLQEKGFAIAALKNELRKLKGNSVDSKFAKPSILGKPVLQPHRNQSVVRQWTQSLVAEKTDISETRASRNSELMNNSKLVSKVVPLADKTATSQQELELLFSPMYEEYLNVGNQSVSKSYALSDNSKQQDT
ncbi:hypothetical protein Tco_0572669 [Tanacetum coccineum]